MIRLLLPFQKIPTWLEVIAFDIPREGQIAEVRSPCLVLNWKEQYHVIPIFLFSCIFYVNAQGSSVYMYSRSPNNSGKPVVLHGKPIFNFLWLKLMIFIFAFSLSAFLVFWF